MIRSIRWSFLAWQTVLLLVVIVGFAVTLFGLVRHAKMEEIDAELGGAAQVFSAGFRPGGPPGGRRGRRRGRRIPEHLREMWHSPDGPDRSEFRERFEEFGRPRRRRDRDIRDRNIRDGNIYPKGRNRPDDLSAEEAATNGPRQDQGEESPPGSEVVSITAVAPAETPPKGAPTTTDLEPEGPRGESSRTGERRQARRWRIHVPEDFLKRFDNEVAGSPYFAVWSKDGELMAELNAPQNIPQPRVPRASETSYIRQRADYREVVLAAPFDHRIVVGRSIAKELAELAQLVWRIGATGIGVLLLGLLGGWNLSKRAIRPIEAISAAAENVSETNLSERIAIAAPRSELGRLADILNATFARLQSAFENQRRFTADASHELRTPVSVILAQTELALKKERSAQEYREVIDVCHRTSHRMKGLVDGLLTLARSDAGKLELEHRSVDLRDLVNDSVALLKPLADEKKVEIQLKLESVEIEVDAYRLSQAVSNLVTNAVRYNRPGGSVTVSVCRESGVAALVVADTGLGIAPEDVGSVFDRFYRANKARSRSAGGSGLGLAITRTIVEAHGGTITVVSVLGHGTTFTVHLPIETPDDGL